MERAGASDRSERPAASDVSDLSGRGGATYVEMRNVAFHVLPDVALDIRNLRGTMQTRGRGPIVFDDPRSFLIHIGAAEVRMSSGDLTRLLNEHVFAYPGAPLRDLAVRFAGHELIETGRLKKGVSVPFEIHATVGLTANGEIRIRTTTTRILGVGVTRLMRAFGIRLDRIVGLERAHGARVEGNDIILDVEELLPPPAIRGNLTSIAIDGTAMVQRFGPAPGTAPIVTRPVPRPSARNYMFYQGGVLRFGKLIMLDADMQIIDLDPKDSFRFDIRRYRSQLVAGYSKTLADGGLAVFMKDIDDAEPLRPARQDLP